MNSWKKAFWMRSATISLCLLGTLAGCSDTPETKATTSSGGGEGGMAGSSGSTGGSSAGGTSSTGGGEVQPCQTAEMCPGMDTDCQTRTCFKHRCGIDYKPRGTPLKKQLTGNCKRRICDGAGKVVEKEDDSDVWDDLNDCTQDACTTGQATNVPVAIGKACSSNGGIVCDGQGACVECNGAADCATNICVQHTCVPASCADGVNNGSESGVDCGGSDCARCVGGEACSNDDDCLSGICKQGVCTNATCSDGKKNGGETDVDCGGTCNRCANGSACNLGLDCQSTLCIMKTCQAEMCGNGLPVAPEACDDGNLVDGDGCSATCTIEPDYRCSGAPSLCVPKPPKHTEAESNDLCSLANGPFVPPFIYTGTLSSPIDVEYIAFTLTDYADVQIEPREVTATSCEFVPSPAVQLIGTDCMATLAPATPFPSCPGIVPWMEPGARHLAPGIYQVRVSTPLISQSPDYEVEVSLAARCGNGIKEGSEQCDEGAPTPGCGADCKRVPVCGDGIVDAPETCEDGNTLDGDCCSSMCQFESGVACPPIDIESNNTCATANGPFALPLVVNMPFVYQGAINSAGDVDHLAITVPAYADIEIETFDSAQHQCVNTDTYIELRNAPMCDKVVTADDDDGPVNCSRISASLDGGARHLAPGTYDLAVRHFNNGTIPAYQLEISFSALCGNGIREGSEQCDGGPDCNPDCTAPVVCGDGLLHADEACDDHNTVSGDGCSATCTLEPNFSCANVMGSPTACSRIETHCNDGLDNDNDGKTDNNDPDCQVPAYFPICWAGQARRVFKSPAALGLAIPEYSTAGISHSLAVPNIGTIVKAATLVNVTHTADADIDLLLKAPGSAMPLDMCSDNGGFGDNFTNTVLDSTCATPITAGLPPYKGCYQPETDLASFIGTSAEGVWTLAAIDDEAYDQGTLGNWAMIFCTTP